MTRGEGVIALEVNKTGGLGKFLDGLARVFRMKGRKAGKELSEEDRGEVHTEAEEALSMAMGWQDPDGKPTQVVLDAAREALEETR